VLIRHYVILELLSEATILLRFLGAMISFILALGLGWRRIRRWLRRRGRTGRG
jgi:hypothetical protein